ncbi:hypothetical protein DEO72_LG9g1246 [Vigna unguiculata]|uniref:Uncharacterized protein n=1 Tax=Vigna unguiculata TaxID=3917 RepID=A0A4D6N2E6_VIGUN|nr:hypothetical protein DEO72_LG9g1246 [Vigna unguiculata]
MITASFLHCCIEVSGFFQKPPGGSFPTARRHIRFAVLFLFWYDPPGGYEFLPGDATLFAFYFRDFVNVLMLRLAASKTPPGDSVVRGSAASFLEIETEGGFGVCEVYDNSKRDEVLEEIWMDMIMHEKVWGKYSKSNGSRVLLFKRLMLRYCEDLNRWFGQGTVGCLILVIVVRQAVRLASGVSVLLGAWRHGVLRQAVTRKQWVWGGAGARRSGAFSPGDVWAEPGGDAVVLCFLVRRAGLRAGRFVEAGPRAGSSPFLFVCGDDRVIRYTGADVDTGGAEDAQMAE